MRERFHGTPPYTRAHAHTHKHRDRGFINSVYVFIEFSFNLIFVYNKHHTHKQTYVFNTCDWAVHTRIWCLEQCSYCMAPKSLIHTYVIRRMKMEPPGDHCGSLYPVFAKLKPCAFTYGAIYTLIGNKTIRT